VSSSPTVIRAVDLFCGAGGLSWGLVEALKRHAVESPRPTDKVLRECIDLVGVNHWERAIETHEKNHPWARHFHDDVQHVDPREVFDDPDAEVKVLSGGIECTHWSIARGGAPVDEQKRMPAWDVLTWVQKLRPENVLFENVKEFAKWGPVDENGKPSRSGETFEAWVDSLHSLGYSVDWKVLNAADYGDATSRRRLFIVGRRDKRATFPEQSHSKDGDVEGTDEWRPASDIIDWSDPGESIWSRSRPLVNNTMQRIAEGIRRYSHDGLEGYADAVASLGKDDVERMQEEAVPLEDVSDAVNERNTPFLVDIAPDEDAETSTRASLCVPYLLGQHGGSVARDATENPIPTVATRGAISLIEPRGLVLPRNQRQRGIHSNPAYDPDERPTHTITASNHDGHLVRPYLVPYYSEREGQRPRTHEIDDPLPTVTATGSDPYVTRPYLIQYNGQSASQPTDEPLPTVTTRDRFALCVPDLYPWGLDIRYRMLQPRELAAAMGFPESYEFCGTKTETTEQIGNAVPVNLARALVENILVDDAPSLSTFTDPATAATDGGVADDD
jgi:DNA (cytosine-5)-methyltransferase 1